MKAALRWREDGPDFKLWRGREWIATVWATDNGWLVLLNNERARDFKTLAGARRFAERMASAA